MNTQKTCHQPTAIIRLHDVMARTGLGKTTIYRKMSCGEFPKRVSITTGCVGWVESEIERWNLERIEKRDALS